MRLSDYRDEFPDDFADDFGDDTGYPIGRRRVRRVERVRPQEDAPVRPRRRARRLRRAQRGAVRRQETTVVRVRRARDGRRLREDEVDPFGPEPTEPPAAEVDDEIEEVITEVIEDPNEEAAVELGARLRRGWGPITRAGNLRIQARDGIRAAILEIRPGLWCIAEVPTQAIEERPDEFGGPIKMATKMIEAVKEAVSKPQPVTVAQRIAGRCKCRWEDVK